MGAYLSEPVTEKLSSDEGGEWLLYGASSMQGWRVSQEDAHNAVLNFDKDTHLFAVYDGHGGHEVSAYTALKLPDFLKDTEAYKNGNISQALTDAFLGFDATLVKPEVVNILKQIAGSKDEEEEEEENSESESEEVHNLYREAIMPLDEVIAKYAENPQLSRCKKEKGVSPYRKAKTENSASDSEKTLKFELEEDEDPKSPSDMQSSSHVSEDSSIEKSKIHFGDNQNGTKVDTSTEVNGEETKHMVNGEEIGEETKKSKIADEKDADSDECRVENGDTIVNGGEGQESGKGKGKGGKGGKGKAVLKNSEVQAMKEAKAQERRREAAIKAAEIYRKIQEGGAEEDLSDEEEEDDDDNFEDEGDEEEEGEDDAEGEESEEDDDVETEEDEDPYTEFAMNMKEEPGFDSGCTACVALLRGPELYVANVGDSRCVVSRDKKAVEMSLDHKPEDDPEAARIIKAGGRVTADGRVNGGLNLSRAIGDHGYKQNKNLSPEEQMISPLPDVRSMTLDPKDDFMIVACDGIWNSLTSQEACDFVSERLADDKKLSDICEELFDHCLAPDTHGDGTGCDNMTCIIVKFKDIKVQSCESSSKRTSEQADNDEPTQHEKKVKSDGE